jgi:hypothetical protein
MIGGPIYASGCDICKALKQYYDRMPVSLKDDLGHRKLHVRWAFLTASAVALALHPKFRTIFRWQMTCY